MKAGRYVKVVDGYPLPVRINLREDYYYQPAHMMRERGFEVSIFALAREGEPLREEVDGLDVRRFASVYALQRVLLAERPDLVHIHSMGRKGILCAAYHPRVVFTPHEFHLLPSRLAGASQRFLLRRCAAILCQTPAAERYYRGLVGGRCRVALLPLPVDVAFFSDTTASDRAAVRAAWGLHDDDFVCVYVGTRRPTKDPLGLLSAFASVQARLPQARLLLVGHDHSPTELKRRMDLLKEGSGISDSVVETGFLPLDELRSVLQAADCFVSMSTLEAQCLAAYEAAAAGLALCLPDLPTFTSVFRQALFHPVGEPQALAANVLWVARDKWLRKHLSEANSRFVRRFAFDPELPELFSIYQSVLGNHAH